MRRTVTLLLLLSTGVQLQHIGDYNMTLVRAVLRVIGSREQWKNTPIFHGHHTTDDDINDLMTWLQRDMQVTCHTVDTSTPAHKQIPLGNFKIIADNSIGLLFCESSQEPIWLNLDKSLRKLRPIRLIVVLSNTRSGSYNAMMQVFKRLWHFQFLNVLVLYKDQIYSYTPYPEVHFYKLDINATSLFPPATNDFQGYEVSTPVENDIPRVFFIRDQKTGCWQPRGYGYRVFAEYLKRHNATLRVTNPHQDHAPNHSVNMGKIIEMIHGGQLEISLHPYVDVPENIGDHSYPLIVARNCLIVPVRNEIPRNAYLYLPLDRWSWLLLLGAVIYISGIIYWIQPRQEHRTFNPLDGISRVLFISSPSRIYRPSLRYFVVSLQLTILGFIVTNMYSIQLSSFFTTLVVGEQVDSMEQLVEQKQKVLVKHYEIGTFLRHVEPRLVDKVSRLLVGANSSEQVSALLSFNRSFAYPFTVERWEFFSMQQQYAFKPIFRFSSACLGAPIIGYPMRSDCHLQRSLNLFIMRVQDSGILKHWLVSDFNDALSLLDNVLGFHALDLDALRLGWAVLGYGWMLSVLLFLCERWRFYHRH